MKKFFLALPFAVLLEGTLFSFPLVFLLLLTQYCLLKSKWVLAVGIMSGMFLDLLRVRLLGQTSLFFSIFMFIVLLYERKFEIKTYPFVGMASFLGTFAYSMIFGHSNILAQAVASILIAVLLFKSLGNIKKLES